jgi:hypothetical protein
MPDGYPTKADLRRIKSYKSQDEALELCKYMQERWRWDNYFTIKKGRTCFGHPCMKVEMHTGGWSGHEEMIDTLMKTPFHYLQTKWEVGGHFYFEIPIKLKCSVCKQMKYSSTYYQKKRYCSDCWLKRIQAERQNA